MYEPRVCVCVGVCLCVSNYRYVSRCPNIGPYFFSWGKNENKNNSLKLTWEPLGFWCWCSWVSAACCLSTCSSCCKCSLDNDWSPGKTTPPHWQTPCCWAKCFGMLGRSIDSRLLSWPKERLCPEAVWSGLRGFESKLGDVQLTWYQGRDRQRVVDKAEHPGGIWCLLGSV